MCALAYSITATAAPKSGGGSSGRGAAAVARIAPSVWMAYGQGTTTYAKPQDDIDSTDMGFIEFGGQMKLFGRFFLPIGIYAALNKGKMQYRYVGPDNISYSAADVEYQMITPGLRTGIQYRYMYTSFLRLNFELGVFIGGATITYNVKNNAALMAQGTKYAVDQRNIADSGWYGESNADLMFSDHYGLRIAFRKHTGNTGTIDALNKQKLKYVSDFAYAAILKEF